MDYLKFAYLSEVPGALHWPSAPFFGELDLGSLVYFQVHFRRNVSKNLGLVSFAASL